MVLRWCKDGDQMVKDMTVQLAPCQTDIHRWNAGIFGTFNMNMHATFDKILNNMKASFIAF